MSYTTEYEIWTGIKKRCLNPRYRGFHLYGGRGITIDPSWSSSFEAFFRDMGIRPDGMSIDRIDVDGPYSPDNCRWATCSEQTRNRRNTVWLSYQGLRMTLKDLSSKTNTDYFKLYNHVVRHGKGVDEALIACGNS